MGIISRIKHPVKWIRFKRFMKANNPHDNTGVPKLTFEKWLEQATPRNPLKTQFDRMRAGNPAEPSNPSGKGWSETGKGDY